MDDGEQIGLASVVTAAWLANPHTRAQAGDASAVLSSVHAALSGLTTSEPAAAAPEAPDSTIMPAVTTRKSLTSPDHILSMIDGKPYRSLTRHLRTNGLTPGEYRERYGLKSDYPMVAPSYSAARSAAAKQHQFGRKPSAVVLPEPTHEATADPKSEPTSEPAAPTKRRRLGISGAKQAARAHLGGDVETGSA